MTSDLLDSLFYPSGSLSSPKLERRRFSFAQQALKYEKFSDIGSVSDEDDEKSVEDVAVEADPNANNNLEDSRTGESSYFGATASVRLAT